MSSSLVMMMIVGWRVVSLRTLMKSSVKQRVEKQQQFKSYMISNFLHEI